MKSRVIAAAIAALMLMGTLFGCASSAQQDGTDYSQYVKLGDYIGVEVEKQVVDVTEADVDTQIASTLAAAAENVKVDRAAKEGDVVNLDLSGKDPETGEDVANTTVTGSDVTLGSGSLVPGIEESVIGKKAGDTYVLPVTFPEDYYNPDMVGVLVNFTITVNSVQESVTPELDLAFVTANSDCATVEEYREMVRQTLISEAEAEAVSKKEQAVWAAVMANCEISDYPEDELENFEQDYYDYYQSMADSNNMELDDLLTNYYQITRSEFDQSVTTWAKNDLSYIMTAKLIAKAENISVSDEDYEAGLISYIQQTGASDAADFETQNGFSFEEQYGEQAIRDNLLFRKVLNFTVEKCVETEPAE